MAVDTSGGSSVGACTRARAAGFLWVGVGGIALAVLLSSYPALKDSRFVAQHPSPANYHNTPTIHKSPSFVVPEACASAMRLLMMHIYMDTIYVCIYMHVYIYTDTHTHIYIYKL